MGEGRENGKSMGETMGKVREVMGRIRKGGMFRRVMGRRRERPC